MSLSARCTEPIRVGAAGEVVVGEELVANAVAKGHPQAW
jgi:hypothetical protein